MKVNALEQELQKYPTLSRFIKLDEKLAWVLGWFVAEGSFCSHGFQFSLCSNTDPIEELRDFFDKLGAPSSVHRHKGREHVVDLIVYSKTFRGFLQECGSGAGNKKIPDVIFAASKSVKLSFINALMDGDGTSSGVDKSFFTIMVASEQLLNQLQFLLASLGILSPVTTLPAKKVYYKKEDRYINTGVHYKLNINKKRFDKVLGKDSEFNDGLVMYRSWDNHFIVPIKEIQKFHYKGPVYNFSVDGDESYVIDSLVVVHNCFEFMGLDELTEQEKHEMIREQMSSYMTLNEGRRSLDMPDLPLGDIPMSPVYIQLLQLHIQSLQQKKAEEQQEQQAMEQQQQMLAQQEQEQGQEQPPQEGQEQPKDEVQAKEPPQALEQVSAKEQGQEPTQEEKQAPSGSQKEEKSKSKGQPQYSSTFGKSKNMNEITLTFDDWIERNRENL